MVAKVRPRSSDKPGLASSFDRRHKPEARGGRGLSNPPVKHLYSGEANPTPPVKHLYTGDPRGLEGLIYESNMYCKIRWKKNGNLDHLIRRAWHLTRPEGRGQAVARARGEGRARPIQPPSKTLIHGRPSRSRGPNLRVVGYYPSPDLEISCI